MKVIDTIKQFGYTQWIEGFVSDVFSESNIHANEAVITDMFNKRIYLMVDDCAYMIRTWNFFPVKKDEKGMTCSEDVEYTLYIGHQDCDEPEDPISLNKISNGTLNIEWVNEAELFKAEYAQYIALHSIPEQLSEPQEGEYMMLHVEDLNQGSFDLKLDLRPLTPEDLVAVVYYFVNGEYDEVFTTPKVKRYLNTVHQSCVDGLIKFCCEDDGFDIDYTKRLIAACVPYNLCCVQCAVEEYGIVNRLYEEYNNGSEFALDYVKCNLDEFFMETRPYSVTII